MFSNNYISRISETERLEALAYMYSELSKAIKDINILLKKICLFSLRESQDLIKKKVAILDTLLCKYNSFIIAYYTSIPFFIKVSPLIFKKGKYRIDPKQPLRLENSDYRIELAFEERKKNEFWMGLQTWRKISDYTTKN